MHNKKGRTFIIEDTDGKWRYWVSYDEEGISYLSAVERIN